MNTAEAIHSVLRCGRRRLPAALAFSLSFKLLQAALVAPMVAGGLRLLLQRWGRASVGNFEIASFLLSPPGLLALVGVGTVSLACQYLEWAGLMRLLAEEQLKWWKALLASGRLLRRLIELGLRQLAFYLLLSLPFLAGISGVYWWFWSGRDLNGLIVLKPPEFWWGAGLAAVIALSFVLIAGRWFLGWLLAVPALLFEPDVSVHDALRSSVERLRGKERILLQALLLWLSVQFLLSTIVFACLHWISGLILNQVGESLVIALPMTAGLLIVHGVVGALLSVLATVTFAGLVLVQYQQAPGHTSPDGNSATADTHTQWPSLGWMFAGGSLLIAIVTALLSQQLVASITLSDQLEITAHRAGAKHAPENSVSAIRQAIRDRADWAEIDVQLTHDLELVVLHDIDLARIGGGNRRVDAVTLAELKLLDIGTAFGLEFAGEQVPTLDEILSAAGHGIRLNVELKPHGKDDEVALTERAVAAIQQAGMVDRCQICSQSFRSLQHARRLEPLLPVGFIAGASIGDLTGLDVDFLMVKAEQATSSLVQRAGTKHIPVHAWTVNDPAWVAPLLDRGVANLITDDPAALRARLDEIRGLAPVQRLLLRARSELLGSSRH